ncbi:conserved hypothetical protein [Leishmania major strain Friedlin]|uniref:Uncharacterized protein n=1 Tax=Leishmania major TaxID=5664 RepID=E9AE60_LEIMA|nr:conserved hypothetical protein [Leishmania major strain Friedlin]CAG9577939.1 hypothetical_protein_-_conserved [Leishmania major strain Friedlin]CBZ12539.1 conserved hypothetical protein [Leishmania major strain Friedlin]|eukprot:XP_003722281.1 conserved hypothetical protein [Leishmania major strain Friedlin]
MSEANFETPPSYTNWGLVLDGDVQQDTVSRGGYCTAQQLRFRRTPRLSDRAGSATSTAAAVAIRQANSSNSGHPYPGSVAVLDDWERSAVDLYREIRRHRSERPQQARNGAKLRDSTQAGRPLHTSEGSSPSPYAALMGTAFPQLLGGPFAPPVPAPADLAGDSTAGTPQLTSSSPLLLQYFLSIGYPLRLPYNTESAAASHSVALVAVAQETVAWFEDSGVAVENTAPSRIAAPLHRFSVRLLPDVVQQMVSAHRMMPATAAAWLLRVYVGLLTPWEAKEYSIQAEIMADHGCENGTLDPGMPPAFCMEGVWRWANAMCTAVYHLQTSTHPESETSLHESEKRSSDAVSSSGSDKTAPLQRMQSLASERRTEDVGWRLFALTVLQKTTTLILRGCFTTSTGDATNASQDSTSAEIKEERDARGGLKQDAVGAQSWSPQASETVMPPVPTTRVVVEGLVCFALLVRLHERFPKRGEMRHDAGGVHARTAATHVADAAQLMVEKHWEGHAQLAVQQLPHLPPHYHHLVHMMDFVLTN